MSMGARLTWGCMGVFFEFCDHVRGVFQVVCVGNWGHMSDFVGEQSG